MSLGPVPDLIDAAGDSSPWRFLEPLREGQAADGELLELTRSEELKIIGDMVSTSRVSLLYAFSGNGKSSLINAGVIPNFRRRGYIVFKTRPRPPWSILDPTAAFKDCVLQNMDLPLVSAREMRRLRELHRQATVLESALATEIEGVLTNLEAKVARLQLASPDALEFATYLRSKIDFPLVQFIGEIQEHLGPETRLLFICDQFEELFVHFQNTPEADRFVEELGEVWATDALKVHFLFSMREDWVGSMITFRRAIPEIFASYYRLAPLTCRCATMVLKKPLEKRGLAWEESAVSTLLADLARAYSANQADRFNGINLTPARADDPYVELPALQIVADELWQTRKASEAPFSLEHYRSLLTLTPGGEGRMPDSETTPAEHLLDSYLKLRLNSIPDAGADREAMQDLRVDCLYALTDRSRHRRALVEGALVEEVRRLRSAALELGEVQPASVQEAVQPLVESRLITEHDAPSGQREVELAHDFAVRSVVQQWRALDRKRTARLALQQQERKRKDLQLAAAAGREKQVLRLVKLAPFGAVVGVLALALTLLLDRTEEIFRVEAFVWSILLAVGLGLAVASRRHLASLTLGAALAIIGLASIFAAPHRLDPPIWVGSVRLPAAIRFASSSRGLVGVEVRNRTKLSFSGYGDLVEPGEQPRQVMSLWNVSSYPGLQELAVDPGFHWIGVRYYEDALQITSDDVGPAGPRIVALRRVNEETYWPNYPTAILLAVLAVGLLMASLLNFSKLHQLTGGRKLAERGGRIVLAEFLDAGSTLLVIVLVGMLVDDATFTKSFQLDLMMGILFGGGGMALLRAELLRRWKRTPGLALAGLRLASRDGGPPGFRRLLARELLLMVWSLFNFAWGLPTFLGTPFIVRYQQKGQNFYDTWAGTRLVDVEVARAAEAAEDRATTQNARAA